MECDIRVTVGRCLMRMSALAAIWLAVAGPAVPSLVEEDLPPAHAVLPGAGSSHGESPPAALPSPGLGAGAYPEAAAKLPAPQPPAAISGNPVGGRKFPGLPPQPANSGRSSLSSGAMGAADQALDLSYVVRPGDSAGSIAATFHISPDALLKANGLNRSSILRVGTLLRIPNPFASQVRDLAQRVKVLTNELRIAEDRLREAEGQVKSAEERIHELLATNEALSASVRSLPWWRGAAITAASVSLVMLIATLVMLKDWLSLRRSFAILVEVNDSLRRLDYKYKAALAKIELRLQQLYGRRRAGGGEGQQLARTPEEFEIERYNEELRDLLREELKRFGVNPSGEPTRSRLRELLAGFRVVSAERPPRR